MNWIDSKGTETPIEELPSWRLKQLIGWFNESALKIMYAHRIELVRRLEFLDGQEGREKDILRCKKLISLIDSRDIENYLSEREDYVALVEEALERGLTKKPHWITPPTARNPLERMLA